MNREQVREAVSDHIPGGSDVGAQEIDEITDAIMALDKPPTVTRGDLEDKAKQLLYGLGKLNISDDPELFVEKFLRRYLTAHGVEVTDG